MLMLLNCVVFLQGFLSRRETARSLQKCKGLLHVRDDKDNRADLLITIIFVMVYFSFFQTISMSQESRIGFVVFGLGRAGHIHATNLIRNPQANLKWIVDIDEAKAKDFVTENFSDAKVVTPSDMEKVLRDPSVIAAVVTTPTHLHEEIVMHCLQAGKAVLCEKPIADSVEAVGENFLATFDYLG